MAPKFHQQFGTLATYFGWDNPNDRWQLILYKGSVISLGLALLVLAFNLAFGTIYTGGAQPHVTEAPAAGLALLSSPLLPRTQFPGGEVKAYLTSPQKCPRYSYGVNST